MQFASQNCPIPVALLLNNIDVSIAIIYLPNRNHIFSHDEPLASFVIEKASASTPPLSEPRLRQLSKLNQLIVCFTGGDPPRSLCAPLRAHTLTA